MTTTDTGRIPEGWQLLTAVRAARGAAESIAYCTRVITHLLATSDHRHLAAWAADLDAASVEWTGAHAQLEAATAGATQAWGRPAVSGLADLAAAAPDDVRPSLVEATAELLAVVSELAADGDVSTGMAQNALGVIEQRRHQLEAGTPAPTYDRDPVLSAGTPSRRA